MKESFLLQLIGQVLICMRADNDRTREVSFIRVPVEIPKELCE